MELRELSYTRAEAAAVALLAGAVATGHRSPATQRLIQFGLTTSQLARIQAVLGGPAPVNWLVDADHTRLRYAEAVAVARVTLGRRGLVLPAAAEVPSDGSQLLIRLPSNLDGVFGSGQHAATRLAAQLLEDMLSPGNRVVDVGTGSGILAVFAVRLGASHVRAFDTCSIAIEAARQTAELNGVTDRMELVLGELVPGGPAADLVIANILAGVLLDLLPRLAATLRPGGSLITSGVVDARAGEVSDAARAVGFDHMRSTRLAGWTASAFRRR